MDCSTLQQSYGVAQPNWHDELRMVLRELALCSEGAQLPANTHERLGNISGPFA